MKAALAAACSILVSLAVPALGQQARVDKNWPSILYFGEGLNEQIDRSAYLEIQAKQIAELPPPVAPVSGFRGITQSAQHPAANPPPQYFSRHPTSGYGAISMITGQPRTIPVRGHYRNGRYVKPYFRSRRR
jgi:hypothetical protein